MKRLSTQERHPNFLEDQSSFFDELTTHDWQLNDFTKMGKAMTFEVDQLFKRIAPERILNVGCGTGGHDVLMALKPTVKEVVGIDYSKKSVELANKVYQHEKVRRYVSEISSMQSNEFDLATSFQVIEHVTDPLGFLKACKRQVRQGGWIAVLTPNRERLTNWLFRFFGKPAALEDPQHFLEYTTHELSRIGAIAGLSTFATFSYGLDVSSATLRITSLVPTDLSLRLGYLFPTYANRFCIIFRV
jgi:2-polyprenyl-3-methyl-5-hydroxy-6-metoxy-1,4-benzoquinol methylase